MAWPGRVFFVNKLKVIICHLLMRYEFQITQSYEKHRGLHRYNLRPKLPSDGGILLLVKCGEAKLAVCKSYDYIYTLNKMEVLHLTTLGDLYLAKRAVGDF